jgi:hypothetical protein
MESTTEKFAFFWRGVLLVHVSRKKSEKPKHIGPGKKIVSIYADEEFHATVKSRAKSLGLNVSKYLHKLAEDDIQRGGSLTLNPKREKGS